MSSKVEAKPRVIVVDDDNDVRQSLAAALRSSGYRVDTYQSAPDLLAGLDDLESTRCVIADIRMPRMSGMELLALLKRNRFTVPVVLITGFADVALAVHAMKAGAVDFIVKPFSGDQILAAVEAAAKHAPADGAPANGNAVAERFYTLTRREKETFWLLVDGHTNKSIAQRLAISPRTVEIFRSKVMEKMVSSSLADLVRMSMTFTSPPHDGP